MNNIDKDKQKFFFMVKIKFVHTLYCKKTFECHLKPTNQILLKSL